mgnify:FL=1
MALTLQFHTRAKLDIRQAIAWYENEKPGLGKKFNLSLLATFQQIQNSPFLYPKIFEDFRKARLPKPFPYKVIYWVHQDEAFIIAVAHDKQHPDFWKDRT